MARRIVRSVFSLLLLAGSGAAMAVGLGELRGQPVLGERFAVDIQLLGVDKQLPDVACFQLVRPDEESDLPWLKRARLQVRSGSPAVLEVRSEIPLREPVLQLAVRLGCGNEVSRQYMVLASPGAVSAPPSVDVGAVTAALVERKPRLAPVSVERPAAPVMPAVKQTQKKEALIARREPASARLTLSSGADDDLSLQLSSELAVQNAMIKEAQREILRLEYRVLMAMTDRATDQLAVAEKLRNMEAALGDLQSQAAAFAQRVEKDGEIVPLPNAAVVAQPKVVVPVELERPLLSDWSFYGVFLGALLGLGGWWGWQRYKARSEDVPLDNTGPVDQVSLGVAGAEAGWLDEEPPITPSALGAVVPDAFDISLDTPAGKSTQVDFELDGGSGAADSQPIVIEAAPAEVEPEKADQGVQSEVNPVMELADIMLSFGRVKGAAQTLQEYIENNPTDALQPWIRLLDVYRMADMREEFENVARNLNRNFNVEVQTWDGVPAAGLGFDPQGEAAAGLQLERPQSLEEMPRLMSKVLELWGGGDVVGYLYQLLRDNRGGERVGFSMPVVDDILFLIELKETANRME